MLTNATFRAGKQKQDFFDEVLKLIKHYVDVDTEHFYYLLDVLFLLLVDESVNLKKAFDAGLYKYFMGLARKSNANETVRACFFKILSYLSKYGELMTCQIIFTSNNVL